MKKKVLAVLIAASMVLGLAACGGSSSSSTASSEPAKEETAAAAEEKPVSEAPEATAAEDVFAGLPDNLRGTNVVATPEMYPNVDMSKHGIVNLYMIGDTPNDWETVLGKINEYLEPFNTEIKSTIWSWSDYGTLYSLSLAGGEDIDLIFTAPWAYMWTEGAKGSFLNLTDEFLDANMPLSRRLQAPESWKETKLAGNTVAVPCNRMAPQGKLFGIRQDIADKVGVPEIKTWEDYMNFMLAVAEQETPVSGIYAQASSGSNSEVWDVYRAQFNTMLIYNASYLTYYYKYNGGIPAADEIEFVWNSKEFHDFAADMKTLADAGCWSRGALSATVSDDDAFGALQGASIAWNTTVNTYMEQAEKNEGVYCNMYDIGVESNTLIEAEAYSNGDIAITASSKDPARAAMVLDILKMDTTVNRLVVLGIEGTHYTLDADGVTFSSIEENVGNYGPDGNSLSWGVRNGNYVNATTKARVKEVTDRWEPRMVASPTVAFVFDEAPVADTAAALKEILADYVPMLQLGLVEDSEATIAEMMGKLEAAGMADFEAEFQKQYTEWAAAN